jgi:hypothetical protein
MTTSDPVADLVGRYVYAVERALPRSLRSDVSAELLSLIQDALEDRAQSHGRVVDRALAASVLQEMGPPWQIAERYRSSPQYLIGPRTYPIFLKTLRIVAAALAGLVLLVTVVLQQVFSPAPARLLELATWGGVFAQYFQMGIVFFGVIVIVFALIERRVIPQPEPAGAWDPLDLPELPEEEEEHTDYPGITFGFAIALAFLCVIVFFPERMGFPMLGPAHELTWVPFSEVGLLLPIGWIGAWCVASIVLSAVVLRHGRWTAATRWVDVGLTVFAALILLQVAAGSSLRAPLGAPHLATLLRPVGMALYALPFALLLAAFLNALGHLTRRPRRGAPRPPAAAPERPQR